MTLTIKEKHLYRHENGKIYYFVNIRDGGQLCGRESVFFRALCFPDMISHSWNLYKGDTPAGIIEEIPTPPIDFSRIGEAGIDGDILFFTIPQTEEADFNGVAFDAASVNRFNMNYWQPARPKPETIEVHGQKYRVEDILKLKPIEEGN